MSQPTNHPETTDAATVKQLLNDVVETIHANVPDYINDPMFDTPEQSRFTSASIDYTAASMMQWLLAHWADISDYIGDGDLAMIFDRLTGDA